MSELAKTSLYLGGALLISALAFITRPGPVGVQAPDMEGKPLFADFKDPYEAVQMKILRYDEELGQISDFEVAQKANRWVIPSHFDYPADAEEQLKQAATALVDLNVVGVASELAGDHSLYGVIEPDPDKTEVGERGVGTLVAMKDTNGNDLADLVIGKSVKDAEGQRYVRVPGQDPVYTVKIDPEKFSTNFKDWIEKDLLDLSAFDIKQIELKDYSLDVDPMGRGRYEQRLEMAVTWNSDDFKWELDGLKEWQTDSLQPVELSADEELNKETLDGLKDALDELQIVDVQRKPEGLRADLRADADFMKSQEAQSSLRGRGFYVFPTRPTMSDSELEMLSSDGEVLVRTKEGVEYILRFGGIAGVATGSKEEEGSLNRFVFVTARVHEDSFPTPEYEQVPGDDAEPTQPPPLGQADETADSAPAPAPAPAPADAVSADVAPADAVSADAVSADAAPADAVSADAAPGDAVSADAAPADGTDQSTETGQDTATETEAEETEAQAAEASSDDATDGEAATDSSGEDATAKQTDANAEKKEDIQDKRDRIIKENERKRKEYEDKRKKAVDKVSELNRRFADWYYVISEDVYKKIHLGRGDVVKQKTKTEEEQKEEVESGFNMDSFRKLQEQGLPTEGNGP